MSAATTTAAAKFEWGETWRPFRPVCGLRSAFPNGTRRGSRTGSSSLSRAQQMMRRSLCSLCPSTRPRTKSPTTTTNTKSRCRRWNLGGRCASIGPRSSSLGSRTHWRRLCASLLGRGERVGARSSLWWCRRRTRGRPRDSDASRRASMCGGTGGIARATGEAGAEHGEYLGWGEFENASENGSTVLAVFVERTVTVGWRGETA